VFVVESDSEDVDRDALTTQGPWSAEDFESCRSQSGTTPERPLLDEPPLEEQEAIWAKAAQDAYEEWCEGQGGCVEGRVGYYGGRSHWELYLPDPDWTPPHDTEMEPAAAASGGPSAVEPPPSLGSCHQHL
jgi:hypothetical protein